VFSRYIFITDEVKKQVDSNSLWAVKEVQRLAKNHIDRCGIQKNSSHLLGLLFVAND
jgi:hypothetical protein